VFLGKMSLLRPIAIGITLLVAQLAAFAGETAVLRNGSQINFVRKEEISPTTTRLYLASGHVDLDTADIASFEKDDTPVAVPDAATAGNGVNSNATSPAAVQPAQKAGVFPATTTKVQVTRPELDQYVRDAAARNRLDPDFVASVIRAESDFKPHAVSAKGAQGLMQLMPSTAAKLGVSDAFDPKANIDAGTAHLNALLNLYHDDPVKALAAYNAGEHRVQQYHGVPPYRETRAYVTKIVRDFNAKKRAQMKTQPATTTKVSATSSVKPSANGKSPKTVQQRNSTPKASNPA
jgi:soluble lytic murein transglycosylase-like protein